MRRNCPTPDDCQADSCGPCRKCHAVAIAAQSERMKRLHAAKRHLCIPRHLKYYARKLRSIGIRGDDLRRAIEAAP